MASIFQSLRDKLEERTGWRVRAEFPFGNEKFLDLRNRLPQFQFNTILDVGANIGQSAVAYKEEFPDAVVHCFEPVNGTAEILRRNVEGLSNVYIHCVALGAEKDTLKMHVSLDEKDSVLNSVKGIHPHLKGGDFRTEEIEVTSLDDWCIVHGIKNVDLLKIDTEGFDLEVLKGSVAMMTRSGISLVDVEVSVNPTNNFHVSFHEVSEFLWSNGFLLFGIYDQLQEEPKVGHMLRRINALFISRSIALEAVSGSISG